MHPNDLDEKRRAAADKFFSESDLLGYQVEDADGWERTLQGVEFVRPLACSQNLATILLI